MKKLLGIVVLGLFLITPSQAEETIDMIFGVKLNNDVSEYAKIESGETDDWLPNIYSFYDNKITGEYLNIERDSTFDEYYLRNRSWFLDVKIVFLTLLIVFGMKGVSH